MTELQMIIATAGLLMASVAVLIAVESSNRSIRTESDKADKLLAELESDMNKMFE